MKVWIGTYPWARSGNDHLLPPELIESLMILGINKLDRVVDRDSSTIFDQKWLSTQELHLPTQWNHVWHHYTNALFAYHIRILKREYEMIWIYYTCGRYSPKQGYQFIYANPKPQDYSWWWKRLWKLKILAKSKIFMLFIRK